MSGDRYKCSDAEFRSRREPQTMRARREQRMLPDALYNPARLYDATRLHGGYDDCRCDHCKYERAKRREERMKEALRRSSL